MAQSPPSFRELFRGEKLLLARGASRDAAGPQLDVLVSLAGDADEEVSRIARETLERLSDEYCAKWLSGDLLSEAVARYFLNPDTLRPALLPVLLGNPSCPQDAIVNLMREAGPQLVPRLLEHLDALPTPALVALKENPSYLALQGQPTAGSSSGMEAHRAAPVAELPPLADLVGLLSSGTEEERRFAEETLAGLKDEDCVPVLADASLEEPVIRYFLSLSHVRPALLPILFAHAACPGDAVAELAAQAGPAVIPVLLDNLDLLQTSALIALKDNPAYLSWQKEPHSEGVVLEVDLLELLIEESQAEALRPVAAEEQAAEDGAQKMEGTAGKIAKMSVAQKVKLALLGSREERAVLIRDGSRVVSRAVLSSPKLTEVEVEGFAAMKNVDQDVLRAITMNRKFMKNYTVAKTLVNNPRLPIDIGLTLLNRLMAPDVALVARNRDVADVIRKMADKLAKTRRA